MKKIVSGILITAVFLLGSHAIAQVTKRISLGGFYFPANNRYIIYHETRLGNLIQLETHTGHNFGFTGEYSIKQNFSMSTGIGLSDFGYDFNYDGIQVYPKGVYKYKVNYIEVPLEFHFTKRLRRIDIVGVFGPSLSFFLSKKNTYYVNGKSQGNYNEFDNYDVYARGLINIRGSIGMGYYLSMRTRLYLLPTLKYSINRNTYSSIPNDDEWTHFFSYGLKISITHKV
jgi:hypothetical protein